MGRDGDVCDENLKPIYQYAKYKKKGKRKVQGVPQPQTAAHMAGKIQFLRNFNANL